MRIGCVSSLDAHSVSIEKIKYWCGWAASSKEINTYIRNIPPSTFTRIYSNSFFPFEISISLIIYLCKMAF